MAPKNIVMAAITMLIIVLIYHFMPPLFSRVAILLGLVAGTIVAIAAVFNGFSVSAFAQNVRLDPQGPTARDLNRPDNRADNP